MAALTCWLFYELCLIVKESGDFVDGLVDTMEVQAAYENGKKALDNPLVRLYLADHTE